MIRKLPSVLLLTSALCATAAFAGHPEMDTDGDGAISLTEMQSVRPQMTSARFAQMDTNNDGLLQKTELRQHRKGKGKNRFAQYDANGDGALDLAELQAAKPDFSEDKFNKLDANGDRVLSKEEMGRGKHKKRKGQGFANLDTDNSGGLSFEELRVKKPDMTLEQFNQRDTNGDGELARGEGRQDRHRANRDDQSM